MSNSIHKDSLVILMTSFALQFFDLEIYSFESIPKIEKFETSGLIVVDNTSVCELKIPQTAVIQL